MAEKKVGFWYRFVTVVVKPFLLVFTRRDWRGAENIPATGGFIAVANHISYVDPLVYAHFQHDRGRPPRYLAKASLFTIPLLGTALYKIGQIPVHRGSKDAANAFRDAVAAIRAGEGVVVYPEGTITKDPAAWPMAAKTGAARIALVTGAPVIPVAQWGAQRILPRGAKIPRLLPPKRVRISAGPPVDLSDLAGQASSARALRVAADRIMAAVVAQLEELRGEQAPQSAGRLAREPAPPATVVPAADQNAAGDADVPPAASDAPVTWPGTGQAAAPESAAPSSAGPLRADR